MPTVLRIGPYRFHFYSKEGNEPAHIHVARDELEATEIELGVEGGHTLGHGLGAAHDRHVPQPSFRVVFVFG